MDISALKLMGYGILLLSHDSNIITAATMLVIAELLTIAKKAYAQ